ncbi:hypothetical protein ASE25_14940 [Terrabacter sp. Root85]|uniref:hypothetical protein n=1 Tax=Terrabacter sp. Root85 TaxID=1736603 RepID=UPI000701CC5F|nr:hypothetical protein [Terrabacter sp. Root85]KRC88154.1 hypothetical protein ASE25_14940 [Terrabacter sp. Root85]
MITGPWTAEPGKTFSHNGTHYPVIDSPALATPVQAGGVLIIIGGGGKRRTPALAVRYPAEFNAPPTACSASPAESQSSERPAPLE